MSNTPRSDVLLVVHDFDPKPDTIINHARQLERELTAANDRIKRLEDELNELRSDESKLLNLNGELERRIKLILEAGDKMFPWSERVGQEFWTKAKEAKP